MKKLLAGLIVLFAVASQAEAQVGGAIISAHYAHHETKLSNGAPYWCWATDFTIAYGESGGTGRWANVFINGYEVASGWLTDDGTGIGIFRTTVQANEFYPSRGQLPHVKSSGAAVMVLGFIGGVAWTYLNPPYEVEIYVSGNLRTRWIGMCPVPCVSE